MSIYPYVIKTYIYLLKIFNNGDRMNDINVLYLNGYKLDKDRKSYIETGK